MIRMGDVIIAIAGVVIIGVLGVNTYSGSPVRTVQIMHADHVPAEYPAWQNREVRVAGPLGETILQIRDGRVRVVSSPCTQKICVRAGWLEEAGEAAACVPNRVSVALLGADPRFDAINF